MTGPFATEAMQALKQRLLRPKPMPASKPTRRRPDLRTLAVWNNNEHATIEQLVHALPPEGGIEGLIADMENSRGSER